MTKWLVYIAFLLVLTPCLSLAKLNNSRYGHAVALSVDMIDDMPVHAIADTIKSVKSSAKNETKVKEVTKAKRQPKPEKVDDDHTTDQKEKPKRQRRPDGMERPPEIPRRNDN